MMSEKIRCAKGFTLIELAIVLVIIGIIMGAIMKGRDIIRDSQVKEYANAFAGKWITMLDTYYSKTGQNLADGTKNGGNIAITDGFMDYRYYNLASADRALVLAALRRAGVEPCNVVKSNLNDAATTECTDGKNVFQTKVDGEYVSRKTTTVCLEGITMTMNSVRQRKNVLVITGIPVDVAVGIDKIYDGTDSGAGGSVVNLQCRAALVTAAEEATCPNLLLVVPSAWPAATGAAGTTGQVCDVGFILEH